MVAGDGVTLETSSTEGSRATLPDTPCESSNSTKTTSRAGTNPKSTPATKGWPPHSQ